MNRTAIHLFPREQLDDAEQLFVVGDLHGDLDSFETLLRHVDVTRNLVVFLGDYADRGEYSVEVVNRVDQLLKEYPDRVIGLKGNHEDFTADGRPRFAPCHLMEDVERRGVSWQQYFSLTYSHFLRRLHLAAIIPGELLFVHGGVSRAVDSIASLATPTREIEETVLCSDATDRFAGEESNRLRGRGTRFGADVTGAVCRALSVKRIVRGHQHDLARNGPHLQHNKQLVTLVSSVVFSRRPYVLVLNTRQPEIMAKLDLRGWRAASISP